VNTISLNSNSYSTFEYQYRDGGNFKSCDFIVLDGQITDTMIERLTSCLIDGMWFMANQVGLPDLFEGVQKWGHSSLDVSWHEFIALRPAMQEEIIEKSCFGKLSDLLDTFQRAKSNWKLI